MFSILVNVSLPELQDAFHHLLSSDSRPLRGTVEYPEKASRRQIERKLMNFENGVCFAWVSSGLLFLFSEKYLQRICHNPNELTKNIKTICYMICRNAHTLQSGENTMPVRRFHQVPAVSRRHSAGLNIRMISSRLRMPSP